MEDELEDRSYGIADPKKVRGKISEQWWLITTRADIFLIYRAKKASVQKKRHRTHDPIGSVSANRWVITDLFWAEHGSQGKITPRFNCVL